MTNAWHLPLSPTHLSPCSPAVGLPLLSSLSTPCITSCTHTHLPPFPSIESRRLTISHSQPRWKCILIVTSSSSSVTVWTLMRKRWVLSCPLPIYLSGQGTFTLISTCLRLSYSPVSHLHWHNFYHETVFNFLALLFSVFYITYRKLYYLYFCWFLHFVTW